ncbi:MAG: TRAP transporter small permease [Alphaproteobacteria bacterium]
MRTALALWDRLEQLLVALAGALALGLALYAMASRYLVPAWALDWADEITVYLVMWGIWLASSSLVQSDRHVRADVLPHYLGPTARWVLEIFGTAASLAFCSALAWSGLDAVEFTMTLGERSISSLRFPLWIYYACVPAGAILMALRYARRLVRLFGAEGRSMVDLPSH